MKPETLRTQLEGASAFDPLDGGTSRRTFLQTLVASSLVIGSDGLALGMTPASSDPQAVRKAGGVPSLDELAGDWLPMNSLGSYPALSNFVGSLQVTDDMIAVEHLTFPPFSQAQDSGIVRINGRHLRATESRWYAYQVLRRSRTAELEIESSVRLVHESRGVLFRLKLRNIQLAAQNAEVAAELTALVGKYDCAWNWEFPVPQHEDEFTAGRAGPGNTLLVRHAKSSSCVAFAFVQTPDRQELKGTRGQMTWKVPLNPGQDRTIDFVMAVGSSDEEASHLANKWAAEFEKTFDSVKALWEKRFADAFIPGNTFFSGSLPVLTTSDEAMRRTYYMSILSSALLMLRTNFTLQPRIYISAAPQWAVTHSYFWDGALVPVLTALLDPAMMREQLKRWLLFMDIHNCNAEDSLSGQGRGPWYSANDVSLFEMLQTYVQVTGDWGFLDEQVGEKTVTEHLRDLATYWKLLVYTNPSPADFGATPAMALADYGEVDNLLECVPTYTHGVASLNAANVGMMRAFSDLRESMGDHSQAAQFREDARNLAATVLLLYVPGQGVWDCLQPDGKHQGVRHVYDFIMTVKWMSEDFSPSMRSEMLRFVEQELMTKYWLRALSLKDPAAAHSDRPDHGPMGAYDAWPPLTLAAMNSLGYRKEALDALHRFATVTREGPFSQAHELLGRAYDSRVRVDERGVMTTHELCGGAFAEVIIKSFFGFQPDWEGRDGLVEPELPRGFNGKLVGLRWRGKLYDITSDAAGVSMKA